MFGRLRNLFSGQPQSPQLPVDLARIIDGLPAGWRLASFTRTGGGDWRVVLSYDERRFEVESESGHPWSAIELIDEEPPILSSPLKQPWWTNGNPEDIHAALAQIVPRKK